MAEFRDFIDIAASPETVSDYLTTNEGMTAWMGRYADLDPTPGGRFAVDIAGHPVRGKFVHVERPSRVVVSWGFVGSEDLPAGASTVEFRLTSTGTGTRALIWGWVLSSGQDDAPPGWVPGGASLLLARNGVDEGVCVSVDGDVSLICAGWYRRTVLSARNGPRV